jgi:DedD protein
MADAPISEELTALKKRARRRLVGAVALMLVALLVLWTVMDNKPPPSLASQPVAIVSSEPSLVATVKPDTKPTAPVAAASAPAPTHTLAAPAPMAAPLVAPAPQPAATPLVATPVPGTQVKQPEPKRDEVPAAAMKPSDKPTEAAQAKSESPKKPEAGSPPKKDPAKILAGLDDEQAKSAKHDKPHDDTASARFFLQLGAFADEDKAKSLLAKAHAAGVSVQSDTVTTAKGHLTRLRAGPYPSRDAVQKAQSKLSAAGVPSSVVGK